MELFILLSPASQRVRVGSGIRHATDLVLSPRTDALMKFTNRTVDRGGNRIWQASQCAAAETPAALYGEACSAVAGMR
jgi:hypothetical protein